MNYCAFLRGVNVKGTNMKMADVKSVFEKAGMKNVTPVLASGNIIFESEKPTSELRKILEKAMSEHFNYDAFLFVKNQDEIEKMLQNAPFKSDENSHLYVFIAEKGDEKILLKEFEKLDVPENENAQIVEEVFYWQVEKGNTLDSSFGKILGRKAYKDLFTSRNINTFGRILKKM